CARAGHRPASHGQRVQSHVRLVPPLQGAAFPLNHHVTRRGASPPFRNLPPGIVAPAKPALECGTLAQLPGNISRENPPEHQRPPYDRPLRARPSPAQSNPGAGFGGGPSRPPPIERWALFIAFRSSR